MADVKRFTNSIENEELFLNTIKYLSDVIDAKDDYTVGHSERVQRYALLIGKGMGLSKKDMDVLYLSSILHDIGKVKVPIGILKSKKKLNKYEFAEIKRHAVYGAYLLGSFKYVSGLQEAIKHHHERFDGKGYPDGLKGGSIPLFSRIIGVSDSFDAMTSNRSYKKEVQSEHKAIREIYKNAGTQFDPSAAKIFISQYKKGYIHLEKGLHLLKQQSVNSHENALFFFRKARARMKNKESRAFIDFNIGKIMLQQGKAHYAIKYFIRYIPYAEKNKTISEVYNELSSAYYYMDDFQKSMSYSNLVLKSRKSTIFEKSRATRHISMLIFKRGEHPSDIFKYLNRSLDYYNKIEEMIEKEKTNIATSAFSIIKYNQLINYTREVKSDLSKYHDAAAFVYLNMGNLERAIENYLKSIDIKHFYGDLYGSIRSQAGIALVYIEQGRFTDAEYNLFEALSYAKKLNNKMGLWMVYNNLGRLYMTWKNYELSEKYYYEAFKVGIAIKNKTLLTEATFFLSRFVKNKSKKRSIIKKYIEITGVKEHDSIMSYMISGKKNIKVDRTEEMFERSLMNLKKKYRTLDYAKLFYNYIKYIKERNIEKYHALSMNIPYVIRELSDSIVRRRLEKIYDINTKIGGDKRP